MPDDTVITTGGSSGYRGKGTSDILRAQFSNPAADTFTPAAAPTVRCEYHTEALLLPDGRIAVFADKADSRPGHFKQRVEVYSPPYLFHGVRPRLDLGGRTRASRGDELTLGSAEAARITRVRLLRPGSATHVTDFDRRSVALDVIRRADTSLTVRIPDDPSLVPPGWYMVVATDGGGTPSKALWLRVR
ncbi:galactose oxidase early set domain-containing protein [Streptomyces sp. C1-1]|uniref:galactose oxidase early set domain-containing protein n=1 Tax=Streptomyces sp. C1-1 TaxID=3231173 RepID=UPI003D03CFC3